MVLHLVLLITPIVVYAITLVIKNGIKFLLRRQQPNFERQLQEQMRRENRLSIIYGKEVSVEEIPVVREPVPTNLLMPVYKIENEGEKGYRMPENGICDCRMFQWRRIVISLTSLTS